MTLPAYNLGGAYQLVPEDGDVERLILDPTTVLRDFPKDLFGFNTQTLGSGPGPDFNNLVNYADPQPIKQSVLDYFERFDGGLFRRPGGLNSNATPPDAQYGDFGTATLADFNTRVACRQFQYDPGGPIHFGIPESKILKDLGGMQTVETLNLNGRAYAFSPNPRADNLDARDLGYDAAGYRLFQARGLEEPISTVAAYCAAHAQKLLDFGYWRGDERHLFMLGNELRRAYKQWPLQRILDTQSAVVDAIKAVDTDAEFLVFGDDFNWDHIDQKRGSGDGIHAAYTTENDGVFYGDFGMRPEIITADVAERGTINNRLYRNTVVSENNQAKTSWFYVELGNLPGDPLVHVRAANGDAADQTLHMFLCEDVGATGTLDSVAATHVETVPASTPLALYSHRFSGFSWNPESRYELIVRASAPGLRIRRNNEAGNEHEYALGTTSIPMPYNPTGINQGGAWEMWIEIDDSQQLWQPFMRETLNPATGKADHFTLHCYTHHYDGDGDLPERTQTVDRVYTNFVNTTAFVNNLYPSAELFATEFARGWWTGGTTEQSDPYTQNVYAGLTNAEYLLTLANLPNISGAAEHTLVGSPWQVFDRDMQGGNGLYEPTPNLEAKALIAEQVRRTPLQIVTTSTSDYDLSKHPWAGFISRGVGLRNEDGSRLAFIATNRENTDTPYVVQVPELAGETVSMRLRSTSAPSGSPYDQAVPGDIWLAVIDKDPPPQTVTFDSSGLLTISTPPISTMAVEFDVSEQAAFGRILPMLGGGLRR